MTQASASNVLANAGDPRPAARALRVAGAREGRWARWLVGAFVVTTVVAPAASFNKAIFVLLLVWLLVDMLSRRSRVFPSPAPLVICAIFVYGFAVSLITDADHEIARQFLSATFVLFLTYFIHEHNVELDGVVRFSAIVLLLATVLFWLSIFWPAMPFGEGIYRFFDQYNFSAATERDFFEGGSTFTLQLGTTPFLFVAFCAYSIRFFSPARRKIDAPMMAIIAVAMMLSGLRGLIAISAMFMLVLIVRHTRPQRRVFVVAALALLLYAAYDAFLSGTKVLSSEEISNAVKIGHLTSFVDNATPSSLLFGSGLASFYYSSGSGALKAYTELTPVDMLRYFGIVLTLVLYAFLMFPLPGSRRYLDHRGIYVVAFILYLALSMTNPVMLNSYGMLIVLWYWQKLLRETERGRSP